MGNHAPLPEQAAFTQQAEQVIAEAEAILCDVQPKPPEYRLLPHEERALTEVDNLNRHRRADGSHDPWAIAEAHKNAVPYVKESGLPSAVSVTRQEYVPDHEDEHGRRATFMWLGRTALQVALSGYNYHHHPAARQRVGVEVDKARDEERNFRPGWAKVVISPRMSKADAPPEAARAEHLGDEDSLQVSYLESDAAGNISGRRMESILVRDVPLKAWVDMLADPNNMFGKSIVVENPESALSVMKIFRELELPETRLSEGVLTLLTEVTSYIADPQLRQNVEQQLVDFRTDQAIKHKIAVNVAWRWVNFDQELADSLWYDCATQEVQNFVNSLQSKLTDETAELIASHRRPDGKLHMSRRLAACIEEMKREILVKGAAVAAGERYAVEQLDPETAAHIRSNELKVQQHYDNDQLEAARHTEAQNAQIIVRQNIRGGFGCPGRLETRFSDDDTSPDGASPGNEAGTNRANWRKRKDVCVVASCPTRPDLVWVGPCGVCLGRCQEIYDSGGDPAKDIALKTVIAAPKKPKNRRSFIAKTTASEHEPDVQTRADLARADERSLIEAGRERRLKESLAGKVALASVS